MTSLATPRHTPACTPPPEQFARIALRRVLVVEDERRMREQLVRDVEAFGCKTFAAAGSHEAIRLAAAERPDVILIDGLLPQMHGFELARFLRSLDSSYRPHIVIVTSIYKQIRYRNEAKLKYGVDAYLIKPVSFEDLLEVLS